VVWAYIGLVLLCSVIAFVKKSVLICAKGDDVEGITFGLCCWGGGGVREEGVHKPNFGNVQFYLESLLLLLPFLSFCH